MLRRKEGGSPREGDRLTVDRKVGLRRNGVFGTEEGADARGKARCCMVHGGGGARGDVGDAVSRDPALYYALPRLIRARSRY